MKIAVLKGCRSDTGLINPILKRLKEDKKFFEVDKVRLVPSDYYVSYGKMDWYLKYNTPDMVIIPGDRIEMMAGATCCFLFGIPIAHIYGGITNVPLSTVDDVFRHNISQMSELIFCENENALKTVEMLLCTIGRDFDKVQKIIKIVGNLYMCDYEIDKEKIPEEYGYYDLVLYNGCNGEDWKKMKVKIEEMTGSNVVFIGSNPDKNGFKFSAKEMFRSERITVYPDLPRSQFLGLLKFCDRFITNSSSAYYEAPTFLKPEQIILIGDRNRARSSLELPEGKPDLVIETIKAWWRKI